MFLHYTDFIDSPDPALKWAASRLHDRLLQKSPDATCRLTVSDKYQDALGSDGFKIAPAQSEVQIVAGGRRGLVYGFLEIYAQLKYRSLNEVLARSLPARDAIRSISRLYTCELEDKHWYHDRQFWTSYLDQLAESRFNRFALTFGMGYNYPFHTAWIRDTTFFVAYPFLFDVDGFDVRVPELSRIEQAQNLDSLKFIGRETARRGMEFQLGLWTQRYDAQLTTDTNWGLRGASQEMLATYTRAAICRLLTEVPEITGLTFRIHVESGIPEGDYEFWNEALQGVRDCGREIEIDMHAKGLDEDTLNLGRRTGMPLTVSPKYTGEHMGLPYHACAIRDRDHPRETIRMEREKLSQGARKFLRYSYGDLLQTGRDYRVLFRIWPGTQRLLLWGDAEFARGFARGGSFAGADGVEVCDPLSFKGRMGTGLPGGRSPVRVAGMSPRHDWQTYAYQHRLWGHVMHNPDAPRDGWFAELRDTCGDAAEPCETLLGAVSRVLPLVTQAHAPSASNNTYWPEIYSPLGYLDGDMVSGYHSDMDAPLRFGAAPTFDGQLFANAKEFVEELMTNSLSGRFTPLDVAGWLGEMASQAEAALVKIRMSKYAGRSEVRRIELDGRILTGLARFFESRFRAAVYAELFAATHITALADRIIDHARRSVDGWRTAADASRDTYERDLTFGPQAWLRGSWAQRLPLFEAEISHVEACRGAGLPDPVMLTLEVARALQAIEMFVPVQSDTLGLLLPETFSPGSEVSVSVQGVFDAPPIMHFRHVNQAERWQSTEMVFKDEGYSATIPAEYTASPYHLQVYVRARRDGRFILAPGFEAGLADQPYRVIRSHDSGTKAKEAS